MSWGVLPPKGGGTTYVILIRSKAVVNTFAIDLVFVKDPSASQAGVEKWRVHHVPQPWSRSVSRLPLSRVASPSEGVRWGPHRSRLRGAAEGGQTRRHQVGKR